MPAYENRWEKKRGKNEVSERCGKERQFKEMGKGNAECARRSRGGFKGKGYFCEM